MKHLDTNNIIVTMGDKKISIAQHWKDTKPYGSLTPLIQEVGVVNIDENIEVFGFTNTLDSLIETLIRVREQNK
tara:strand:+ start:297 stop:518 length:222 start_codon:yes stop_codon:yes gene_type:complete